ncbi:MAG: bacterio-opsin activator domain-containing protein [Haloglomus sp.]
MHTEASSVRVLYAGEPPADGPTPDNVTSADAGLSIMREVDFATALDAVKSNDIDAAVAVHRAGGFDGLSFLRAVRQADAEMPVVLLTEVTSGDVARRAVDHDVTAFVPVDDDDAVAAVVDAIEENAVPRTDVDTVRRKLQDLSFEAERRLKEEVLDEAPIGITISDASSPENRIIYANDAFEGLTGYDAEEFLGVNHRFLQGPETDPERVSELGAGIAEQRDTRVVLRNYTKDGAMFWNQVDVSPIRDRSGDVTHWVGFQMDVTEREEAQRQLAAERAALDRILDRVNGIVDDVTKRLVRGDTREAVESLVTERFGAGDEYVSAWFGRYDEAEDRVTIVERAPIDHEPDASEEIIDLSDAGPTIETLREVLTDQELRVVSLDENASFTRSGGDLVFVPITYRRTIYGVLAVETDDTIDERECMVLGSLGRTIGTSINDILTKRTMVADTIIDVRVQVTDCGPLTDIAADVGCRLEHEAMMTDDRNRELVALFRTDYAELADIVATAESYEEIIEVDTLVDSDDDSVIQFRLDGLSIVDILSEHGAELTGMEVDGRSLTVAFRVGVEDVARSTLDELRATYDELTLEAYQEVEEPTQTAQGFRDELRNQLTDRQLTALQKAYVSGFFEWPREAEGKKLAASMDIVPSTYHQHLQAAERKLVSAFFDE